MGPFCVTRRNPTHHKGKIWTQPDPTRPDPIQLLFVDLLSAEFADQISSTTACNPTHQKLKNLDPTQPMDNSDLHRFPWLFCPLMGVPESRRGQLCISRQPLRYTALGMGCAPLLHCLGRLSFPPFVGR